ncbi:hypothetical protein EYE40_09095 [Glaciihabitans arcticus]|uniref:Uncharacterized protein n=1 Tax=Glaciihabitans arcticus TaxID=2668039 RepID=A0A4Q9GRG6_9MICO|nr:hypothetical protein [Glaciihabitans arcticus]TBN57532.1 hypothetical protein EYE40_09095 [Glaciihabitans arcticus]
MNEPIPNRIPEPVRPSVTIPPVAIPAASPRRRRDVALVAVGATALVFGAALPTTPAAAAPNDWLAEIPLSSELSTPTVASGELAAASGAPAAAGLPVVLYGWPSTDVLGAMQEGDTVKLTPVGKAVTDASGRFDLRIENPAEAARLAGADGLVNLEIQAFSPEGIASHSFSKRVTTGGDLAPVDEDEPGTTVNEATATKLELVTESHIGAGVAAGTSAPSEIQAVFDKTDICGATLLKRYPGIDAIVGRMYSSTSGIQSSFSIASNATATVGVAKSVSGKYATFSQTGTSSVTSGDSFSWNKSTLSGGRQFRTDFTYGRFSNWCYPIGGTKKVSSYSVRPVSWDGGGYYGTEAVPSVPAANCRPFGANTSQTRSTSAATKTTNGIKISSVIGIDLSSSAGYTAAVKAGIHNVGSVTRKLCGTNGVPTSPGRYLAKA